MNVFEESVEYHQRGRKGKIEVVPTKPCRTQHDLSLAYTPGVAEPCLRIEKDPVWPIPIPPRGTWWRWFRTAPPCWAWATSARWPASR